MVVALCSSPASLAAARLLIDDRLHDFRAAEIGER
jgi:hypothetical protein